MTDAQRVYVVNHPKVVFTVTGLEVIGIMGTSYVIYRIYRGGIDGLINDIKLLINVTLPFLVKLVPQIINTVVILLASSIPEITQGFGVVIPVVISSVLQSVPNLIGSVTTVVTNILKGFFKPIFGGYEIEPGSSISEYVSTRNDEYVKIKSGFFDTNQLKQYENEKYKIEVLFKVLFWTWADIYENKKSTPPKPRPPTDDEKELKREQPFLRPDIPDEGGRFKDGVQILPIEFEDAPFVNPILEPYDPNKRPKNLDPENKRPPSDFSIFDIVLITGIIGLTLYYFTQ